MNTRKTGTYRIKYSCRGTKATRTVIVEGHTKSYSIKRTPKNVRLGKPPFLAGMEQLNQPNQSQCELLCLTLDNCMFGTFVDSGTHVLYGNLELQADISLQATTKVTAGWQLRPPTRQKSASHPVLASRKWLVRWGLAHQRRFCLRTKLLEHCPPARVANTNRRSGLHPLKRSSN